MRKQLFAHIATVLSAALLLSGSVFAWTPHESARNWLSIASSADGTKLVAVAYGSQIYTSVDGGANWTPRGSAYSWRSVASSADGTKLVAVGAGGYIYTSSDSGVTWTPRDSFRTWFAVASSADGTKLVATVASGPIYTSVDSGITWTPHEQYRKWFSVASSADGTKLVAADKGGYIYTSDDSGVSWTPREIAREWISVASSADGTKLVAAAWPYDYVYISEDSGVSWTPRGSARDWFSVASSADGSKVVAVVYGGQIYTSNDGGISWTPRESARNWYSIAFSADGRKLAAVVQNGQIYTSTGLNVRAHTDFDADGNWDILWRNASSGENYLYPMNGRAILGSEGYLRTVADPSWQVAGLGDFDGDGKADILWRNRTTGENYIYLMNGTAIAGEGFIRTVADLDWTVVGIGDFNGDGMADVLWRNVATGENYVYPMNSLAILGTEGYLRTVADLKWSVVGVRDLDGDGKADLLWRNTFTGENYLYPMDGLAIKPSEGYLRTVADLNWQVAGLGDVNDDDKADILWRNRASGENYLYPMDGTTILGTEGYLRTVADLNWQVKGIGDYDGDGKADVLWRNAATGENYIYFLDGTTIKPSEGYVRAVADQNWKPRRIEGVAHRRANLDGAQVPAASAATGSGTIAMNLLTGDVSGAIVTSGLASISDAHIHVGATGVNGDVTVGFAALNTTTWAAPAGATMPAANYLDFLNGDTYVNVHTPTFPSGEIRGQLQ